MAAPGANWYKMAMPTAALSLYCPPMPINKVSRGFRRTVAEPMKATITFEDQTQVVIENVVIPPTEVHRIYPLYWIVHACIGAGQQNGYALEVELPQEASVWRWRDLTMVALSITAAAMLTCPDGRVYEGDVVFPDCRVNLLVDPNVAEAVTATGTLTQLVGNGSG
jgi:hypothetical protein